MLLLSGLNIPISEELMILIAGALGSICSHETDKIIHLYLWVFLGCWLSAWEAYWVGRLLGPKLLSLKWFRHIMTAQRLERFGGYINRFGVFTYIIGRFIPCGVRNSLFMISGFNKMPFGLFILRDFVACLIATAAFFYLGHLFGENVHEILRAFKVYEEVVFLGIVLSVISLGIYIYRLKRVVV